MANADAWQAGIDIASGGKGKKKDDSAKTGADASSKSAPGGLLGLASKGLPKLRGKGQQQPPAATSVPTTTSPLLPGKNIPVLKKGGRVKKTGLALVHKGEYVVPAKGRSRRKATHKRTVIKA